MEPNTKPGPTPDDLKALYAATTAHWAHAEQIRWTLLYNYLMASTILLLAWSTLFAVSSTRADTGHVLVVLGVAGSLISLVWVILGVRATQFVGQYQAVGEQLERTIAGETSCGPFVSAAQLRNDIASRRVTSRIGILRLARSGCVVSFVPGLFLAVYLYLLVFAIR